MFSSIRTSGGTVFADAKKRDAAKKGDTYYLYFPAKDKQGAFRIGVATSKDPMGPFKAQPQPIKGSYSIDPAVFTDDDGQSYMYFGGIWGGQLQRNVNGAYDPNGSKTDLGQDDKPALGPRVAKMTGDMLEFAETPRAVQIVEGIRENLRVLLVSGSPHSGERTWRNLLKSDASVDLVHFTILRPPEKQDGTPIHELSLIAFPTRELFEVKLDEQEEKFKQRFDSVVSQRSQLEIEAAAARQKADAARAKEIWEQLAQCKDQHIEGRAKRKAATHRGALKRGAADEAVAEFGLRARAEGAPAGCCRCSGSMTPGLPCSSASMIKMRRS